MEIMLIANIVICVLKYNTATSTMMYHLGEEKEHPAASVRGSETTQPTIISVLAGRKKNWSSKGRRNN